MFLISCSDSVRGYQAEVPDIKLGSPVENVNRVLIHHDFAGYLFFPSVESYFQHRQLTPATGRYILTQINLTR